MALLVKNAKFRNTEITAPELYVRLQYTCPADGTKANANLLVGVDKQATLTIKLIATNIPEYLSVIIPEGQSQDLAVVHTLVKADLESKGFVVTIQL
jgi:hypothetical protein